MATASTSGDVCEWQLTKNTVSKRIKYMYRNALMADVHFTVADGQGSSSRKVNIPCHKFILAVSSPVFYKMFYGDLKEPSDYIDLPDCGSEGFLEFLRFVYCNKVHLTGDCVIQVFYLAKKYMIPSLERRCRKFLGENINAENVLDVLPVVEKMEEAHLISVCWKVIDTRTAQVLESAPDAIQDDNNLLLLIFKRDTLNVNEVKVFQAVNRWAETILNRNPGNFSCIPRCLNRRNLRSCIRVGVADLGWVPRLRRAPDEFTESTSFSVNVPILLGGVVISGNPGKKYTVKIKLNGEVVSETCLQRDCNRRLYWNQIGFHITFEQYHLLNSDIPCILEASIKGKPRIYSVRSGRELVFEEVTFRFAGPAFRNEDICIVEILFRPFKNN